MRDRFEKLADTQVSLVKSSGGVFEITVNDELVFSKKALGRFPSEPEIDTMLKG